MEEHTLGLDPVVSVIIPVYKTAQYVCEALDSVLTQTYTDFEIIVVNDGSPDSGLLEEVLNPYRNRITYIVQENRGSSAARNSALKVARGKYVAMLDSDDRLDSKYLASQIEVLESDVTVDVVYPDALRFTSEGVGRRRYSDSYAVGGEITFLRVLTRKCQIYGGVTARRDMLLRVGMYDEELRSGEDYELWLRVLKAGGRISYNDRVLAYYRMREGSHTSNSGSLHKNLLTILEKVARDMELTAEESSALNHQRAVITAMLSFSEGRQAFIEGDVQTAITKLKAAAVYLKSWKLWGTIAALTIAPSILRWMYRLREAGEVRRAR
jgi:GT2 family glycosyltransferase